MSEIFISKLNKIIRVIIFSLFSFLIPLVCMIVSYKPFGIIGETISFFILFFAYLNLYKYVTKNRLYIHIYNFFGEKKGVKSHEYFSSMMGIGLIISLFGLIGCILTSITITTIRFT